MVVRLGKYFIFYRHMLYGSALCIGTVIGSSNLFSTISLICLIIGTILMAVSVFVTVSINLYPEEFKQELKERGLDEHLPSSRTNTRD